jgi:hypothetical protein
VPRIADAFLESIVHLYPSVEDAEHSRPVGGTGFLVTIPYEDDPHQLAAYVITNAHVAVNCSAIRLNLLDGGSEILDVAGWHWAEHQDGDDLAALHIPLHPGTRHHHRAMGLSMLFTREEVEEHHVGLGDDVYFMGRFVSHDGRDQNLPVVRWGTIARMPGEPIRQVERGFDQESYLVEARSLSGFSGSPVMLHIPPFSFRFPTGEWGQSEGDPLSPTTTTGLLGVDWGHLGLPGVQNSNTGIMAIVPSWKLRQLLLGHPDVLAERQRRAQGGDHGAQGL